MLDIITHLCEISRGPIWITILFRSNLLEIFFFFCLFFPLTLLQIQIWKKNLCECVYVCMCVSYVGARNRDELSKTESYVWKIVTGGCGWRVGKSTVIQQEHRLLVINIWPTQKGSSFSFLYFFGLDLQQQGMLVCFVYPYSYSSKRLMTISCSSRRKPLKALPNQGLGNFNHCRFVNFPI